MRASRQVPRSSRDVPRRPRASEPRSGVARFRCSRRLRHLRGMSRKARTVRGLRVLMLATGFFLCSSLGVFHYFGAAKASQDAPQDGAMLDLVLESIFGRFWEASGRPKRSQDVPKRSPDGPRRTSLGIPFQFDCRCDSGMRC